MVYRKNRTKRSRTKRSRRNKRTRSYKKGGQFNTPPRNANGQRFSAAYGQPQQQYGQPQQQQNYSPQGNNNLMGAFNAAATPGPLTGRYNQSGQFSPSSVAYPGYN